MTVCSDRENEFFYNSFDFYKVKTIGGPIWSLSKTNSFYLVATFSFFSSVAVTPVCYAAIYRFLYLKNASPQTPNSGD